MVYQKHRFLDPENAFKVVLFTITHKSITELIPKRFRFGNSSTQITEYNSQNNSVRDSVILSSHLKKSR